MKFEFSEDENLLKSSLNRYLKSNYAMRERRRIIASEEGYSVQCWSGFAELGLLGLPYSEELGGYGGGIFEALAVQMEMGRSISVEPYLGTVYLAGACIAAGVNETLKHDLIPKVIDGSLVLAFAHEERASQGSLAGIGLTASSQDEAYVLNGEKLGVGAASIADKWVVSCVSAE
jgi:alkylation response protein AidB-like acyl-CoA dehydrogenase